MNYIKIKDDFTLPHMQVKMDFELKMDGLNTLEGPNGIGKSTIFYHLFFKRAHYFTKRELGFLQQTSLAPVNKMSVADMFRILQEEFSHRVKVHPKDFGLFAPYNLEKIWNTSILDLSGGENQLVKFLSCIYLDFDFYLLDEPLHSLDKHYKELVLKTIVELQEIGKGFFIIEHLTECFADLDVQSYALKVGIDDWTYTQKVR